MTNSILVGEIIYSAITNNQTLSSYIGTRVYPLVAPEGTSFPFVVYTRANAYPSVGDKDGWCGDKINFQITVASEKYDESATIANYIRDLFENCIISNNTLKIKNIHMVSISEMYQENTFVQNIYFECDAE